MNNYPLIYLYYKLWRTLWEILEVPLSGFDLFETLFFFFRAVIGMSERNLTMG